MIYKVLLFYNPYSGDGMFTKNLDIIIQKFQERSMIVIPVRADKIDLLDKVFRNLDVNEYKKIIAAGGDGTINTVVNAMIRNGIDIPLAIFPSGTANDYAYYFGIPEDLGGMLEIALNDKYTLADVGKAGSNYFINVMALGMLVDVSQKTDPNVKNTLGIISYYLKGVQELPGMKPIPIKVTSEEMTVETNMLFMIIMNGRSAGGFKKMAPCAEINDGKLEVMIFGDMNVLELPTLLVNLLSGKHMSNKNVISFKTSRLRIESPQEVNTDIDGETGDPLPIDVEVLPRKLRINTFDEDMGVTQC